MKTLFLTSSANAVIDDIITHLEKKPSRMKLAFILTASEDRKGDKLWLNDDRNSLQRVGFNTTDYTLTGKTEQEVREDLVSFDVLFFSGGNSFYLLKQIQLSHSAQFFREQAARGVIYIGSSAGSVVAGKDIEVVKRVDTNRPSLHLKGYEGLGLVDFTVLPHWGSEYFKNLYLNQRLEHAYTMENKLILLTDKQYVYVKDDWYQILEAA